MFKLKLFLCNYGLYNNEKPFFRANLKSEKKKKLKQKINFEIVLMLIFISQLTLEL